MGRIRKYFTKKEQREAQRKWQMEHYERNKEKLRKIVSIKILRPNIKKNSMKKLML